MSFQAIRYYYERAVIAVCNSEGIEYRAENQLVPGGDASSEYVTARLQFTNFNEEAIGCIPPENIEGVFIVEHFCEKGIGPAKAQDVMQKIICTLISLNERPIDPDEYIGVVGGVGRISGPRFAALEMRPYFFAGISAPIRAAYYGD